MLKQILRTFTFRKNKKKFKYKLSVNQVEDTLIISGLFFHENLLVKGLCLKERNTDEIIYNINIGSKNTFSCEVNLNELAYALKHKTLGDCRNFDWFIRLSKPCRVESINPNNNLVETGRSIYKEDLIRLGRFQITKIENIRFYKKHELNFINYITNNGNLSLVVNHEVKSPIKILIDKMKRKGRKALIEGLIFTKSSNIKHGTLLLKARESKKEIRTEQASFNLMKEETKYKYGLNRYRYSIEIDLQTVNNGNLLEEDVYDLFFEIQTHDMQEKRLVRIGKPSFKVRYFLKELYAVNKKEATIINPYFTFKASNLSFEVYKYPLDSYKYLKFVTRWSWLIRWLNRKKQVWLVGERTYKAQDTGYAFFKYVRENHPDDKTFYVIDKNSPEYENLKKLGNVLHFKSKEHIFNTIISKKVLSSHHPDYLYPIRTENFKRKVKATKIFLQHGIMGTKNMVANYGINSLGFDTDLFLVSSDFEKEMIVNDFGYDPDDVYVTGLSRFDSLFAKDISAQRQILIIPTWRDWIITEENFVESEYYARYKALINCKRLHALRNQYNFKIVFCLHPNMQRFSSYFNHPNVSIINQGDVDVQNLIKESALMITDYSSVGFDFSFLHKPVLYYQFDVKQFIGNRPSHLDLPNELPGEILINQEELITCLARYVKSNFQMLDKYQKRADKFLKYRDQNASKRIYNIANHNVVRKKINSNSKYKILSKAIFNKFRKSKLYFPVMKLFYNIGRRIIPVDKKMILIESGLGKQYADSPKSIYEEIIRQELDYKIVWVYNKQHRFINRKTKRIQRLSPQYYYYLLKSRYWINNQNFPAYIKKRPETIYLQTWHGTPLKKMLYDLESVHGRDDGYVERIGGAVKNWDYLISPSPYASAAFKSAFKYKGKILEVGYPRNDIFYKDDIIGLANRIKRNIGIPLDKKIILYAPTFRDDQTSKNNKFLFEIEMNLNEMKERLGDEYVVLLRMHVVVSSKLKIDQELSDFAYNVSNYPDIQELYLLTDILITDYSSVFFDFANTGKPMIFFTYDLENYRDNLRGFYMDFENEAPGPFVYNTKEIIDGIENIDKLAEEYKHKYQLFIEKYCGNEDGKAAKRVVDKVFNK